MKKILFFISLICALCITTSCMDEDERREFRQKIEKQENAKIVKLHTDYIKYATNGNIGDYIQERNYYYDIIDGHEYLVVCYGNNQYRYAGMTHSINCKHPDCINKSK